MSLTYASPNDGYRTDVRSSSDPVDVVFTSSRHTSDVYVTCSGGQPNWQISERGTS